MKKKRYGDGGFEFACDRFLGLLGMLTWLVSSYLSSNKYVSGRTDGMNDW